jgi:hypothetical protein
LIVSGSASLKRQLAIVAIALAAGCAAARKDLGEVQVKTLRPQTTTQQFDYVNFHLQEGRVFVGGPYTATDFDLVAMDDGCLRGSSRDNQLAYCPVSGTADPDGTWHWRSVGRELTAFSTQLRDGGRLLEIVATTFRAELELGKSPVDAEIRRNPGLIGAAFAQGLFPASKDEEGSDSYEHEWKYVLVR